MNSSIWIAMATGVMVAALIPWAKAALNALERSRVKLSVDESLRSQAVAQISDDLALLSNSLVILEKIAYMAVASATALLVWSRWPDVSLVTVALIGTAGGVLVIQAIMHRVSVRIPSQIALKFLGLARIMALVLAPIVALLAWLAHKRSTSALAERGRSPEDDLHFLLKAGEEQGIIEEEEKEMIASIVEFSTTRVREVMVPRVDIVAVDVETSLEEAAKVMLEAGHSRVPVYRDSIDHIVGVLYAKDLLRYLIEGKTEAEIGKIARPAYLVPETKNVDELLRELQQRKVHMAIVVDEYGGTAGLVTIEDLLEEIVGEIQDEFDTEEPEIEEINGSEFIFSARVSLDEVSKRLYVAFPSEGGDTLGGFIYSQLGRVPAPGDTISFGGVTLEVLSVDGQRIERVRARRETRPPDINGASLIVSAFLSIFALR
ncbi:MAG: hemolysin family protein [Anaerolineae bacterium]|nr:hemolysin family protein [Anaerolineae bacterium]MDW8099376.1 hemolysin family protein [Anaerolineae bacterium]